MPSRPRSVSSLALAGLAALVVTGCTGGSGGAPATTSVGPSTSASAPASPSASPTPTATTFTTTCDSALPLSTVSTAAGVALVGETAFVVGEADASIGRLAYLNCRYGVIPADTTATTPAAPTPGATDTATTGTGSVALEIGVSLYDSADRATTRVQGTVDDYRASGSTATAVPVGSVTGTVLTGGGPTTLVVADGARTVAVSADPGLITSNDPLVAVAELALAKVS